MKNKMRIRQQIGALVKETLYVLLTVLVLNSFVLASFEVPTASMENTVMAGDRLLVNKLSYGGNTPYTIPLTSIRIPHFRLPGFTRVARGDVIVFDWPGPRDQVDKPQQIWYLKRCIGLPGDSVKIENRAVYVNGQLLPLPPLAKFLRNSPVPRWLRNPDLFPRGAAYNEDQYGPIIVPRKGMMLPLDRGTFEQWEVFIRREGHDSRLSEGKVYVDGVEATSYSVERDYIFAMGDNRDNSLDSRFWGFVPLEDVVGTPLLVLWSWDPGIPFSHPIDKLLSIRPGRCATVIR